MLHFIFGFSALRKFRSLLRFALFALPFALPAAGHAADGRAIALYGNAAGARACASCHGEAGEGIPANGYPRLSGLAAGYLVHELDSFASGARGKVVMTGIAKALSPEDRQAVAAYYASQSSEKAPDQSFAGAALIARGRLLAQRGDWANGVPGCRQCHGPEGQGVGKSFPALAGQSSRYISNQLQRWKNGERSSDPIGLMTGVANRLSDGDIAAVAAYYASLPAAAATSGETR